MHTGDGYILGIQRIPHGKSGRRSGECFLLFSFLIKLSHQQFALAKTKALISFAGENKGADQLRSSAKLISAFVFATRIVQFLFFLNPKFPASIHLLCLYRPVCVGPGWEHKLFVFSRTGSIVRLKRNPTVHAKERQNDQERQVNKTEILK